MSYRLLTWASVGDSKESNFLSTIFGYSKHSKKKTCGQWTLGRSYVVSLDKVNERTVSGKTWDKAKAYLTKLDSALSNDANHLFDFKYLESAQGFLCHLEVSSREYN